MVAKIPSRDDITVEIRTVPRERFSLFFEFIMIIKMGIRKKMKTDLLSFKLLSLSIEKIVDNKVKNIKIKKN
jgi:hypothetical protein